MQIEEAKVNFNEETCAADDKKWHARNVMTELSYCGTYMKDRKDVTNLDLHFYAWLFRAALKKNQGF